MRDDIQPLYGASEKMSNFTQILFWVNILVSIISLFCPKSIVEFLTLSQVITSFSYIGLSTIDDCTLWYKAEQARRKDCIQDAFNANLQELKTENYYTNDVPQSIAKYGVNIFESNYYSKEIARKMLPREIIKSIGALVVVLISFRYIANGEVLLLISQTLFSAFFIINTILLIVYYSKMSTLYDEAYTHFVSVGIKDGHQLIWMLSYILEYECVKAYFKVRLKTSIFNNHKEELAKNWEEISSSVQKIDIHSF